VSVREESERMIWEFETEMEWFVEVPVTVIEERSEGRGTAPQAIEAPLIMRSPVEISQVLEWAQKVKRRSKSDRGRIIEGWRGVRAVFRGTWLAGCPRSNFLQLAKKVRTVRIG
jgi:hypothetical protein